MECLDGHTWDAGQLCPECGRVGYGYVSRCSTCEQRMSPAEAASYSSCHTCRKAGRPSRSPRTLSQYGTEHVGRAARSLRGSSRDFDDAMEQKLTGTEGED